MSGGALAYQLRPNKAVDRNLMIELLGKLNRTVNISDYAYYGFGGPFLEDFKLMHAHLRINKMTSIEADEQVHLRQKFNSPLGCIKFLNNSSGDFLESEAFDGHSIVWLDFTDPAKIGEQLDEVDYLITKLSCGDIVKITLNCTPSTLGGSATEEKSIHEVRLEILESKLNEYFPPETTPEMLTTNNYAKVIFKALELAIKRGMNGKPREYFQVLSSYIYKDGQQMLTLTGIILSSQPENIDKFFTDTRLRNWPLGLFEWTEPTRINVPELSVKERNHIDSLLPNNTVEIINASLGYVIDGNDDEMFSLIDNYKNYYRYYPQFSRVIL